MNGREFLLPACLAAFFVLLPRGAFAQGADDEPSTAAPSIEEMLAVIEARREALKEARRPGRAAAAKSAAGVGKRKAGETSEKSRPTPEPTDDALAAMKKVEKQASERLAFLRKERRTWDVVQLYVRLEKFTEAAKELAPALKNRNTGHSDRDDRLRMDRLGEIELEYARIMAYLGKQKTVEMMLEAYRRRMAAVMAGPYAHRPDPDHMAEWHAPRLKFIREYPEMKREIDELEASLAEEPDGGGQWKLVRLCEPGDDRASLGLKWLVAILDMIEKHPRHKHVRRGRAHWELAEAYSHHGLHEEAIAVLRSFPERFPKSDATREGDWLYVVGKRQYYLGRLGEDMRDRRGALASFREALASFRDFQARYPESGRCKAHVDEDGRTEPSAVQEWMRDVQRAIHGVGGG